MRCCNANLYSDQSGVHIGACDGISSDRPHRFNIIRPHPNIVSAKRNVGGYLWPSSLFLNSQKKEPTLEQLEE